MALLWEVERQPEINFLHSTFWHYMSTVIWVDKVIAFNGQ